MAFIQPHIFKTTFKYPISYQKPNLNTRNIKIAPIDRLPICGGHTFYI